MDRRSYIFDAMDRYWTDGGVTPATLPMPDRMSAADDGDVSLRWVRLPEWAHDFGRDGMIPVPEPYGHAAWEQTDWAGAAFWYLHCRAERAYEERHGPVHSNSSRLHAIDPVIWERCWVNRIALFLRRWTARHNGVEEEALGPLPTAEIILTCDLDAVRKTPAIRAKQTVFRLMAAAKLAGTGKPGPAARAFGKAVRFALSPGKYDQFETVAEAASALDIRKICHVYAGTGEDGLIDRLLFNPSYRLSDPPLRNLRGTGAKYGWETGMHQAYGSWRDLGRMQREKASLERSLGNRVTACRQHWLRFSFRETWRAQDAAGMELDSTLGFNDRPGFRNGAALAFHPWDEDAASPLGITAIPLALMDSQLFSGQYDDAGRKHVMKSLIQEIYDVRGQAALLWHPHTLSGDFGWADPFLFLIEQLKAKGE